MASIEGIGRFTPARIAPRATSGTTRGFALPEEAVPSGAAAASAATAPAAALTSMLTLQELGGETVDDREARRRGQDLLAALADLQRALLSGGGPAPLQRLAELAAMVPPATDRRIAALVSAIVVRARVELARRGF